MKYLSEQLSHFAADYSCGAYGAGAYSVGTGCETSTTPGLAGTGFDVLVPLAAGSLMIVIATVYFGMKVWRKKKTQS